MDASSDSEQDFEAEQDKILIGELSRHAESTTSRKRRPAELLPVGQSSDDDDDDDEDDEAAVGQFQDLLKRARLQRLRKEVAEDMGDSDEDDEDEEGEAAGDEKAWAASRRYRYAAGDSDDDEGEGDDDGDGEQIQTATTSRLMRLERDRLRRRLLGVGVPSDLPDVDAVGTLSMAASTSSTTTTRLRAANAAASSALVQVASELPTYQRPPPGVSLERHLLDPAGADRWPDMRRAYELKTRLEFRLKPLVGKPEAALTGLQAALKWHYILLCAYLRMRANSAPGLHRHPVRRLLRRAGDALRRLGDAAATQQTARANAKSKAMTRKVMVEKATAKIAEMEKVDGEKATAKARKADGEKAKASEAAAGTDASGHRPIYWEMQKNLPVRLHKRRQLAQKKRKLGDSNPRVKLRDKYRRALIKRRSQVPEVRPEVNRYSGELSGIRAGLVKSRKFK